VPWFGRVFVAGALGLVYWAAAGTELAAPLKALSAAVEIAVPLAVGAVFPVFFGGAMLTWETAKGRTRALGLGLVAVGLACAWTLGILGPLDRKAWGAEALTAALRTLPEGAAATATGLWVSLALVVFATLTLKSGLEKADAFYSK
jgi:hypothetical protein